MPIVKKTLYAKRPLKSWPLRPAGYLGQKSSTARACVFGGVRVGGVCARAFFFCGALRPPPPPRASLSHQSPSFFEISGHMTPHDKTAPNSCGRGRKE